MKDPNLRRCTPAARGVWMDIICLMFECEERGVLASANRPWTDEEITAAISGPAHVVRSCIRELLDKGVAYRNQSGAIFSKRIVRDEHTRRLDRDRQSRHRHGDVTQPVTPVSQRSSSSASSSDSLPSQNPLPNPLMPQKAAAREGQNLEEMQFRIYGETVYVKKPRQRRLWTSREKEALVGSRAADYVAFLQSKGFEARVVHEQP